MRNKAAEFSANCVIYAKYNLVITVSLHVPILMASSGSDYNVALTSVVLSSACGKQQCGDLLGATFLLWYLSGSAPHLRVLLDHQRALYQSLELGNKNHYASSSF